MSESGVVPPPPEVLHGEFVKRDGTTSDTYTVPPILSAEHAAKCDSRIQYETPFDGVMQVAYMGECNCELGALRARVETAEAERDSALRTANDERRTGDRLHERAEAAEARVEARDDVIATQQGVIAEWQHTFARVAKRAEAAEAERDAAEDEAVKCHTCGRVEALTAALPKIPWGENDECYSCGSGCGDEHFDGCAWVRARRVLSDGETP